VLAAGDPAPSSAPPGRSTGRVLARVAAREEAELLLQDLIPEWLARPASMLSTLAALAGAGLVFWSAVTGGYWWAIWGVISFVAGGCLWYLADYAGTASTGKRSEEAGP
jgi:hypothetical protein